MRNPAIQSKRENIEVYENAGGVFNEDSQCRFAFGDGAKACYQSDKNEVKFSFCSALIYCKPVKIAGNN